MTPAVTLAVQDRVLPGYPEQLAETRLRYFRMALKSFAPVFASGPKPPRRQIRRSYHLCAPTIRSTVVRPQHLAGGR